MNSIMNRNHNQPPTKDAAGPESLSGIPEVRSGWYAQWAGYRQRLRTRQDMEAAWGPANAAKMLTWPPYHVSRWLKHAQSQPLTDAVLREQADAYRAIHRLLVAGTTHERYPVRYNRQRRRKGDRRKAGPVAAEAVKAERQGRLQAQPYLVMRRPRPYKDRTGRCYPGKALTLKQYIREVTAPNSKWPWEYDARTDTWHPADPVYSTRDIANARYGAEANHRRQQRDAERQAAGDTSLTPTEWRWELAAAKKQADAEADAPLAGDALEASVTPHGAWAAAIDRLAVARDVIAAIKAHQWRCLTSWANETLGIPPERGKDVEEWAARAVLAMALRHRKRSVEAETYRMLDAVLDFVSAPGLSPDNAARLVEWVWRKVPGYREHCVQKKADYTRRAVAAARVRQWKRLWAS
jgi:hypothetical protein